MERQQEPNSWGEYLNAYRNNFGSRSYVPAGPEQQQVRFTRSVPGVCPLAETTHPLYSVGTLGHSVNAKDGSYQRAQRHGWGDVTLLKEEGLQGQFHPHGVPKAAEGKKAVQQLLGKDGRNGLFGLLQGTEAGGVDSWIGNQMIDPTKGKRAVSAPTDEKRTVSFTQLLAHAAPALNSDPAVDPAHDAWIGNIAVDPAKGKAHSPDPSSLRGRADMFAVIQQQALQEPNSTASEADAWIGNRMIQPNKGKKPVDLPEDFQDHLFAATFKGGPPADGCYSDMPPIGKRPLQPPSKVYGFVTAEQTMRMEDPLPPTTVVGKGKPCCKGLIQDPYHTASKPEHVDVYSIMKYQPLTEFESTWYQRAWNDAPNQTKKKLIQDAAAAESSVAKQRIDFQPNRAMRYVPFGGIAQEKGMTADTIIMNRNIGKQFSGSGGNNSSSGGKLSNNGGRVTNGNSNNGGRHSKQQQRSTSGANKSSR